MSGDGDKLTGKLPAGFEMADMDTSNDYRPYLMTDEVVETMCEAIEKGCPFSAATLLAGVSHSTANNWKKKGEDALNKPRTKWNKRDQVYALFALRIRKARGEKIKKLVANIWEAGFRENEKTGLIDTGNHRWLLERTERALFGPKAEHDVKVTTEEVSPKKRLEELIAGIAEKSQESDDDGREEDQESDDGAGVSDPSNQGG